MNRTALTLSLTVAASLVGLRPADAWTMKEGPLMTRWAKDVKPDAVLPEYPRPQMVRADWLNLNGVWEYQPGHADDQLPTGKLASEILVPFPVESAISGVMEHHDRLWYRRSFTVPAAWRGRRTLLHFGAVDYESEVFVNGKSAGVHKGGYDPFTMDVSALLNGDGPQELVVRVFDPTNDGGQPRGKQSLHPGGIMYTPTTGIWQTVWLEPVATGGIDDLKIVPDVDAGVVRVTTTGAAADAEVTVTVRDGDRVVATAKGTGPAEVTVPVANAKLWSPDTPFLYDLQVSVAKAGQPVDTVSGYFGMRKSSIGDVNGVKRMMLNNKPLFQFGPLDQGFWPDGIYTQPTEAALKYDIQTTKDLGFNMIRKHIKVEPARWYYWCDHLGLVVWQDMPSANSYTRRGDKVPPVDKPEYADELTRIIGALRNVPSIVMWDTFNEGQGQHDTAELVALCKKLDPTRLVNEASGGRRTGAGDLDDIHSYPPPNCPAPNKTQALACGEYGGIVLSVPGHMWVPKGHGYTTVTSPADLVDLYAEFADQLKAFRDDRGLSAAVYTQTTDVEDEINGLLTYDRIPKGDVALFAKATRFEIPPPAYEPVVPTSEKEPQPWRYTTAAPDKGWMEAGYDDAKWTAGTGGFGAAGAENAGPVGTPWNDDDVWLRQTVQLKAMTPEQVSHLFVRAYHGGSVQVFVNGVPAWNGGWRRAYENAHLSDAAKAAIKPGAANVIAVHCKKTRDPHYVDVGLVERVPGTR